MLSKLVKILIITAIALYCLLAIADVSTGSFSVFIKIIPATVLTITNAEVRFPDTKATDGEKIVSNNELEGNILVTANEGGIWQMKIQANGDFINKNGGDNIPIEHLSCRARVNNIETAEVIVSAKNPVVIAEGQGNADNYVFGIRFFLQNLAKFTGGEYNTTLVLTLAAPA